MHYIYIYLTFFILPSLYHYGNAIVKDILWYYCMLNSVLPIQSVCLLSYANV